MAYGSAPRRLVRGTGGPAVASALVAVAVLALHAITANGAAPEERTAQAPPPASTAHGVPATLREYKKTFRTYPFSDPDPIATFERIYPYFRYDGYTAEGADREWTVVELENAFLRVLVLPEIGGKIWTAIEKSTGRPFIYFNQVVKFRDVAMRGPWTSGGIEANYGIIGHTPNVATPVDYVTHVAADGAASITIGTLDLLTRTRWRLEISLPADTAFFTTRSLWQNTSGIEQPYYSWMNAGLKAAGNLEFIFPGTHYLGHGGEAAEWPMDTERGKNLAFYEQNDFGSYKSYHVFGELADFFAAYWHDDDFGMARHSTRDDKPGQKIWIWGLSPQGMLWEPLLTDEDGQYVEVQSGRLFNQAAEASSRTPFKHRGFLPYATDTWTEYWFPVKGTGGLVKANDLGALNVRSHEGGVQLAFSPLRRLDTTVDVFDGDTRVHAETVSFTPMRTWTLSLGETIPPERLRVRIAGDRFEYSGTGAPAALSRPVEAPAHFDWTTAYGLALKGKELIRQRAYGEAESAIDGALRENPHFVPALVDKALLRLRAADHEAAYETARRALSIDTYDAGANYYYALASLGLGRRVDARDGFQLATQDVAYRAAALTQLARLSIGERRFEAAGDYAARSLEADHASLESRLLLALAHRLLNRPEAARAAIADLLARDPLHHGARFEAYRVGPGPATQRAFVRQVRHELPHQTYLELAAWYHALRREDDARQVLALAPEDAEVLYWRAYLDGARRGAPSRDALARAAAASPRFVFPFRPESIPVFEWALEQDGGWKPAYYLALLVRSLGDDDRARRLLEACGDAPDFAPFYVVRAQLTEASTPDRALADLRRAAALEPSEWRVGKRLVERALADGRLENAQDLARRYHAAAPGNYILGMLHARTLLAARRYEEALALLGRLRVLPYEGATEGRALYREANLMLALEALSRGQLAEAERLIAASREWPPRLGAGKPYPEDTDERLEDWIAAAALEARGAQQEARAALERIATSTAPSRPVGVLITALALQRLGRAAEADALVTNSRYGGDAAFVTWARRVLQGERETPPASLPASDETRVFSEWLVHASR